MRRDRLCHRRDATFEVGGRAVLLAECSGGEHEVGLLRRVGQERVDRQDAARACQRPPSEGGVGAVVERIGAEQHEQIELAIGGGTQRCDRIVIGVGGRETELERADDIAASQRREHPRIRHGIEHGAQRRHCRRLRFGEVAATGDDDHVAGSELGGDLGVGERALDLGLAGSGQVPHGAPRVARQAGADRRELEDARLLLLGGVAEAEVEHRQLFLDVRSEQDHGGGAGSVVDSGPRQPEHLGRETVAELRVAILDVERVCEARPRQRALVRGTGAAQHADRRRFLHELLGDRHRAAP